MATNSEFRSLFAQLVAKPDEDIYLDLAALYLAGEEYPGLDVSSNLAHLDALATQVSARVTYKAGPTAIARSISGYLFHEVGFHGNSMEYYNPDNSFLNRVLETHAGIPITLSLLFIEVARRLDLRCSGIGLPGHFIVSLDGTGEYFDPFNSGALLSAADCKTLVQRISGGHLEWADEFLAPCTKHSILLRMLNNLKSIYMHTKNYTKAVGIIERMTIITPGLLSLHQEQAWCHAQQHEYRLAINVLEGYLEHSNDSDNTQVKDQINGLWGSLSRLN